MVWTQPMTFTANSVLTAAQLNVHLRDNLMASEAALVQEDQDYIISDGWNLLTKRKVGSDYISTLETTTSTEYTDLKTVGPTVTLKTGNRAWVILTATSNTTNGTGLRRVYCGYSVTKPEGVETPEGVLVTTPSTGEDEEGGGEGGMDAADTHAICHDGLSANAAMRRSYIDFLSTELTPGFNTFTMKYRVGSESTTGSFNNRQIIVIPM